MPATISSDDGAQANLSFRGSMQWKSRNEIEESILMCFRWPTATDVQRVVVVLFCRYEILISCTAISISRFADLFSRS